MNRTGESEICSEQQVGHWQESEVHSQSVIEL